MNITFLDLLNTSISASWLVLVVILLRLVLKRAPKAIHCALWALVAIRLLCPITIESEYSLVPSSQTVSNYYLTQEAAMNDSPAVLEIVDNPVYPQSIDIPLDTKSSQVGFSDVAWTAIIWPAGMALMGLYMLISWLRLRKRVAASVPIARNILLCDYIDSPFILGVLPPQIYLPSDMDQGTLDHVLAHERAHLARKDHWWKPLGFVLLSVHWFNPVMWLAYILLCRDIELACDEKVIRDMGTDQKKAYSSALLRCSVSRPMIAACPLAFGEVGVKERIKSILNYKKPAFWFVVLAIILCAAVAVCFLTDPPAPDAYDVMYQNGYTVLDQQDHTFDIVVPADALSDDCFSDTGHSFGEKEVIVYQTDSSTIWLMNVQYANEGDDMMYFEFNISHDLYRTGTLLLPERVKVGTRISTTCFQPSDGILYDGDTTFENAVSLRANGPEHRFTVYIDTAVARAAEQELRFSVVMNQLAYKEGEPEEAIFTPVSLEDGIYLSQEQIYWSWFSSHLPGTMTMTVEDNTLSVTDGDGYSADLLHLDTQWQTSCPISDRHRNLLDELKDLQPAFAYDPDLECRYLIIDDNHFLAEHEGELYIVKWYRSEINLEIIDYIFRMVPEDEYADNSGHIHLGYATLETDPEDSAIYSYLLEQYAKDFTDNISFHTSVSFHTFGTVFSSPDYPGSITKYLNVRIAHYTQGEDGTITEVEAEIIPVIVSMDQKEDGTYEIVDCIHDDTEYPDSAFLLEVECWRQAYSDFQPELQPVTAVLQEEHPEYFRKDTSNGLNLLWWNTDEGIRCVILVNAKLDYTSASARNHPPLTVPEALLVLNHYHIDFNTILSEYSADLTIHHIEQP